MAPGAFRTGRIGLRNRPHNDGAWRPDAYLVNQEMQSVNRIQEKWTTCRDICLSYARGKTIANLERVLNLIDSCDLGRVSVWAEGIQNGYIKATIRPNS